MESKKIIVEGLVQGVGFRQSTKNIADQLNIKGYAANVKNHVEIVATGEQRDLKHFIEQVIKGASPNSRVEKHSVESIKLDDIPHSFSTK